MAGGGAVGGRLAQDSLPLSKCADAAPIRRRGSALSCDAERRAYQCCREYLGGAWRRVRPEELRVDPVRWEVRGQPLPECGPGAGTDAGSDAGHRDRGGADRGLSAWCGSAAEASATCCFAARCRTACPAWARSPGRCCCGSTGPSCR